jgi:hypothetical protein
MVTSLFTDVSEERAAVVFRLEAEGSTLHGEVVFIAMLSQPGPKCTAHATGARRWINVPDPTFQRQSVSRRLNFRVPKRVSAH